MTLAYQLSKSLGQFKGYTFDYVINFLLELVAHPPPFVLHLVLMKPYEPSTKMDVVVLCCASSEALINLQLKLSSASV